MNYTVPVLFHNNQFYGLSYVASYRQDFKHLRKGLSRSPAPIPKCYVAQPTPRRSMVTRRPTPTTTNTRSAGQAPSPQHIGRNPPPPSHGVNNMRYSPKPIDESDSYSDCCTCSEDEHETDFSSRATSPDDEFDTGEDELARRKRQIVDGSMLLFRWAVYKWFAEVCGVVTHGGEEGRGTKRSADKISGRQSAGQTPPGGGRKRLLRNEDGSGVGEEEDSDQEGGGGKKKAKRDVKFACPYYKHNPEKYMDSRTCCGPGWEAPHRVREHLFRRHLMPTYICPDCNSAFKTNDQFVDHIRTADDCARNKQSPPEGVMPYQEKLLKARQSGHLSDKEKWVRMYKILFPDDDVIPTPYYHDETDAKPKVVDPGISNLARYLKYDVFPKFRRELEREAEAELDGVNERIRNKVYDVFQNVFFRELHVLEYRRQQVAGTQPSSSRPDSGLATPEPAEVQYCAQPQPQQQQQQQQQNPPFDFYYPGLADSNYTWSCDFSNIPGVESVPQDLSDIFAARTDDDGCASGSNEDSAYGAAADDFTFEMNPLLPSSLGF